MPDPGKSTEKVTGIMRMDVTITGVQSTEKSYYVTHGVSPATFAISSGNGAVNCIFSPVMG